MRRYLGQSLSAENNNPPDQVLDLQTDLRALGYLANGLDGVFGPGTQRALTALTIDLTTGASPQIAAYNKGRIASAMDALNPALGDCLADMLDDVDFAKVPNSADSRADNAAAIAALKNAPSNIAPTPFLLAIVKQESDSQHFQVPSSRDSDNFVVLGLDRNDASNKDRITSRGYGLGQFTIFHHPPAATEVSDFITNVQGNVSKAYAELRAKFDAFVTGPADTADDRKAEHPLLPLRLCIYARSDPRYMNDCGACARAAPARSISCVAPSPTPFYSGAPVGDVYSTTQYYANTHYSNVPDRAAFGCDWPYAARKYNGAGVNSYHYQTKILINLSMLP